MFSSFWAFTFTYLMLRIIDMFTTVKVGEADEGMGLDESLHGEHAYEDVFGMEEHAPAEAAMAESK